MIGMIYNMIQIWKLAQIYAGNLVNHRLFLLQPSSSSWEGPRHATQSTSISEPGLIKPSLVEVWSSLAISCHEAFCWSKVQICGELKNHIIPRFSTRLILFQKCYIFFDSQMFDLLQAIYTKSLPFRSMHTKNKGIVYFDPQKTKKKKRLPVNFAHFFYAIISSPLEAYKNQR